MVSQPGLPRRVTYIPPLGPFVGSCIIRMLSSRLMCSPSLRRPCIEWPGSADLWQDVKERTSMGLCDVLFALLSHRLYEH